jgi:hypothetical protein
MDAKRSETQSGGQRSAGGWIFQANPDRFDIDEYLKRVRMITWMVRQSHLAPLMETGDRVFIWRAKGKSATAAGVIASGWLAEKPKVRPEDPVSSALWRGNPSAPSLRVTVDVDRVARGPRAEVRRDWLLDDPVLRSLRILRVANETNFLLDVPQARRLEALWARTGADWSRAEAIAGLWAYHQSAGGGVSKTPRSPVSLVAERIGRSVGSVYNKVMNFRALDPCDARRGLQAFSEMDRAVWEEMYDAAAQRIRSARLEQEFETLWPIASSPQPDTSRWEQLTKVVAGPRGQGFVADARTRKAIEDRAMDLAIRYYQRLTGHVENTSRVQPYDLWCPTHSPEIRVEVKGSTRKVAEVQLTVGEVKNAEGGPWRTDLFVVSNIQLQPGPDGPQARGGEARVFTSWRPEERDLEPLSFRYRLSRSGDAVE